MALTALMPSDFGANDAILRRVAAAVDVHLSAILISIRECIRL
jgi:hypothetical protein